MSPPPAISEDAANALGAVLIDIELMGKTGGIRVLLHALAEGTPEMTPLLASAFLHIVDCPSTRVYLKPGIDLEVREVVYA